MPSAKQNRKSGPAVAVIGGSGLVGAVSLALGGGYEILAYPDKKAAARSLRSPRICLVAVDMTTDGAAELVRRVKSAESGAQTPVIAFTGYDGELQRQASEAGADDIFCQAHNSTGLPMRINGLLAYRGRLLGAPENDDDLRHMKDIINSLETGVVIYVVRDGTERVLAVNPAMRRLTGGSEDVLLGVFSGRGDLIHPDDLPLLMRAHAQLLSGESSQCMFRLIQSGSSSPLWLLVKGSVTVRNDGSLLVYNNFTDITVQKKMEQRYHSVIINAPGGLMVLKSSEEGMRIVLVNPAYLNMLGVSYAQFIKSYEGDPCIAVHPDDELRIKAAMDRFQGGFGAFHETFRLRSGAGGYIWVSASGSAAEDDDGHTFYINFQDVTALIEARQTAQTQKQIADFAISRSSLFYFEYDISTHTATVNAQMQNALGVNETIVNFPEGLFPGPIHPQNQRLFCDAFRRIDQGSGSEEFEARAYDRQQGAWIWLRFSCGVVRDRHGVPTLAVCTAENVDAIKEMETAFNIAMTQNGMMTWKYDLTLRRIYDDSLSPMIPEGRARENVPDNMLEMKLLHPDDASNVREVFRRLHGGQDSVSLEARVWDSHREEYVWYRMHHTVLRKEDGERREALCSALDISKEKEEQFRFEQELSYHDTVSAPNLLLRARVDLEDDWVEDMTSFSDEEDNCFDSKSYDANLTVLKRLIFSEVDRKRISRLMERKNLISALSKGSLSFDTDYQRRRLAGGTTWVRMTIRLSEEPGTKRPLAFFCWYDVQSQKLTELAINKLASTDYDFIGIANCITRDFRILVKTSAELLPTGYSHDYDAAITEAADRGREGFASEEDYIAAWDGMRFERVLPRLGRSPTYSLRIRHTGSSGLPHTYMMEFRYADDEKTMLLVTRTDVTDVIEREDQQQQKLREALHTAETANRAKGEFLARMSHDMRTPLNSIMNFSRFITETDELSSAKKYAEKIRYSANYLATLINDSLGMSRIESGKVALKPEPYEYSEFETSLKNVLEQTASGKDVELIFTPPEGDNVRVLLDKLRMQQVFINILNNGIKFTPAGGRVSLSCTRLERRGTRQLLRFVVADTGIGMSREFMENHLFKPFSQEHPGSDNEATGTGLGLSIAKSLITLMGGTIKGESELGRGTTFTIDIPAELAPASAAVASPKRTAPGMDILSGLSILLCEDHPMNREIAEHLLKAVGCQVTAAENGQIAVDVFSASEPGEFAAILMDIRMPVMNGLDAARAIRALEHPDAASVPIIAMTANAFDEDVQASLSAGMNAHLAKPVDPKLLYQVLAEQVAGARKKTG